MIIIRTKNSSTGRNLLFNKRKLNKSQNNRFQNNLGMTQEVFQNNLTHFLIATISITRSWVSIAIQTKTICSPLTKILLQVVTYLGKIWKIYPISSKQSNITFTYARSTQSTLASSSWSLSRRTQKLSTSPLTQRMTRAKSQLF